MENRVICRDPVRVVLLQQTQVKKGLFRKATVDAAAIGDGDGKALTPYCYIPDSIGEYNEHGLVSAENLRFPGEKLLLNLQGESLGKPENVTVRDNCIEYGVEGTFKGLAAPDGTILLSPFQDLPGAAVAEKLPETKTNHLAFSGQTVIFGLVPRDPRLTEDTALGAAVLEGNKMKVILPREYSHLAFFGEGLLAAGRKVDLGGTSYIGGSMALHATWFPVFQLYSAKTGEPVTKTAFTSIVPDTDGNYRAVAVEGLTAGDLRGKGGSAAQKAIQSSHIYEVTLDSRFEEISGHREARNLIL